VVLGAVVLCVTGAEALYADMGHFGARPIRLSWTFFVLPSLVLNYFGQGALMLRDPRRRSESVLPDGSGVGAAAAGGAGHRGDGDRQPGGDFRGLFDDAQCMQLGFLPRMTVRHTSEHRGGPDLRAAGQHRADGRRAGAGVCVQELDNLAAAYGIAVTGTFICTCVLAMVVFRRQFHWSRCGRDRRVRHPFS
jgi:KUP system potassium uptake protein